MSAMTRTRATEDNVPTALMTDYFAQRATAGLIVTDCTAISTQGKGVIRGPSIWRNEQIEGWRPVTQAVHNTGGRIFCLLWHCGRVADPGMREGEMPVAPSPLPAEGDFFLDSDRVDFPVPRELSIDEIPGIVADFKQATRNAQAAGFDGVELHGANGYPQDQFPQDKSNVGVRLGPSVFLYGADDSNKRETFGTGSVRNAFAFVRSIVTDSQRPGLVENAYRLRSAEA